MKLSTSVWKWILWNLTKFQLIQVFQTIFISVFSIHCLIELKFCEVSRNSISNWTWKFHLSILKNKKVLFLKKKILSCCQYQNKKPLCSDSIFRKGFCSTFFSARLRLLFDIVFSTKILTRKEYSVFLWKNKIVLRCFHDHYVSEIKNLCENFMWVRIGEMNSKFYNDKTRQIK